MALEFLVRNQRLKLFSGGPVVADSQQYLKARFTFSDDWQGTRKYAQFRRNGEVYTCNIDDKGEVEVPWETLVGQGVVQISAFATNQEDETNKLITTNPVYIKVNTSGIKETELPKAPSLGILGDYVDQSLQEITDHKNQVLVYIEQLHADVMEAKDHIDQTDYKIYVGETEPSEEITNAMVWINPAEDDNYSDELAEAVTAAQNAATSVQKYKALWFDSVASMKAEPSLTAGAYVCTAGYYAPNDGGCASYLIRVKADADVDDAGSIHELANGLVAELIVENGTVNVKQFGAKGDGVTDDSEAITRSINSKTTVVYIPNGIYVFTQTLSIPSNKNVIGSGIGSVLLYKGISIALDLVGQYNTLSHFKLSADNTINSENKIAININKDDSLSRKILLHKLHINNFTHTGVLIRRSWHVTIDSCRISGKKKATAETISEANGSAGVRFYYVEGTQLSSWTSSGNIFRDTDIYDWDYGALLICDWDTLFENCVFSGNIIPIYKANSGTVPIVINCWFEDNVKACQCGLGIRFIGGRNTDYEEITSDYNNGVIKEYDNILTQSYRNFPLIKLGGANKQSFITGFANKARTDTFVDGVYLKGYSYYDSSNKVGGDNFLTAKFSVGATGSSGGNGQSFGGFRFSAGATDGNNVRNALHEILSINYNGTIAPENLELNPTIGTNTKMFTNGFFKNITLQGDDGNNYKISINASGSLVATKI